MLVLHISNVSWPDIAIHHENNEIRKILGHLNAFDQSVCGADLFARGTEITPFHRLIVCPPLNTLASKLLGLLGNCFVFTNIEPSAWFVLNTNLWKLWNVLDEAVPRCVLHNFSG